MQTIERPTEIGDDPRPPKDGVTGALIAAAIALPVAVFLIQSKWGVLIAVLLAMCVALGLWVWKRSFTFIQFMAFTIHFEGLGKGQISLGRGLAIVIVFWLAYKVFIQKWRPPALPVRHWLPPLVLTAWCVISGAWSPKPGGWFLSMALLGLGLAYFAVGAMLVDSHAKVFEFLRAYWWGGLFGSAAGVLALFLGTRSFGFTGDPNFFGILEASMVPLTVYYRRNAPNQKMKWLYTLTLIFVLAGAAGAGSRSGLIGGAIAIVATMVTKPGLSTGKRMGVASYAIVVAGLAFGIGFVANPANLQRGFNDRGAGRLDFWTVTADIIAERPLIGQGFGQTKSQIPPRLPTTPGVQAIVENREEVGAHNTWLDIISDLGAFALVAFVSLYVLALISFFNPRWLQLKEISVTMAVMLLPVISGSFFLSLINNKLAWCAIGLAAAVQVPSANTRWRGFVRRQELRALPRAGRNGRKLGSRGAVGEGSTNGTGTGLAVDDATTTPDPQVVVSVPGTPQLIVEPELAKWDLRVSRRFRMSLVAGALIGAVVFGGIMAAVPVRYSATAGLVAPNLESQTNRGIFANQERAQVFHTLARTEGYAAELKALSGLNLPLDEIVDRLSVDRPKLGVFMEISYSDTDEANVLRAKPYLITALDNVLARQRALAVPIMNDEVRPREPGQQPYYTDDLYMPVYRDGIEDSQTPKTLWATFIGTLSGAMVALGFMFFQQRKPRVNNDDDLAGSLGLGVWTHVGRAGRRFAASPDQYAHVVASARDMFRGDEDVRRLVIATPEPDRDARALAMGVAAAIAAEGRRVILVDGQVDRPLMTARLAPFGRRGSFGRKGLVDVADGSAELADVVRRVSRWSLPVSVRRTLGRKGGANLRFLGAGRTLRRKGLVVRPEVLERFDPDVTVVLLAPSLLGSVPAGPSLAWADAAVLAVVEGRTVTFDAEDAAVQVQTFVVGAPGIVMLDV